MGQTLANRLGADPRFGHDKDDEIVVFHPFSTESDVKFVNVDTTTKAGIIRAEELGLVPSGKVDMIFTSDINFAADHLFDSQHKGRILAFFRHPIDRLASKFYYLQTATWERTYRPEWQGMNIIEWATNENLDENFIVKKIMGKKLSDTVDMDDLIIAKEIVRRYFVIPASSRRILQIAAGSSDGYSVLITSVDVSCNEFIFLRGRSVSSGCFFLRIRGYISRYIS